MKTVVITGSTRGIGYGLADAFLTMGCRVTVSEPVQASVEEAVVRLASQHGADRVFGYACDATRFEQVQALWDAAQAHFGAVHIWINNAGISHSGGPFWEQPAEQIKAVTDVNLVGAMYGSRVALSGMMAQGFGHLYNVEGLGSDGQKVQGLTLYGTTKYGIRYLTGALAREVHGTPVRVGALSPGMVVTDLLKQQYEPGSEAWEKAQRIFNVLADRVETVTPWLARQVLGNDKTGVRICWLTKRKIICRVLTAPFHKRNLFA